MFTDHYAENSCAAGKPADRGEGDYIIIHGRFSENSRNKA